MLDEDIRPSSLKRDNKDPMYQLICNQRHEEFNKKKKLLIDSSDCLINFHGWDFRGLDLRGFDFSNIDFSDSYFRGADMRGLDLRSCNLEGASIHQARISGVYFPKALSAEEIALSVRLGTRMRQPGH